MGKNFCKNVSSWIQERLQKKNQSLNVELNQANLRWLGRDSKRRGLVFFLNFETSRARDYLRPVKSICKYLPVCGCICIYAACLCICAPSNAYMHAYMQHICAYNCIYATGQFECFFFFFWSACLGLDLTRFFIFLNFFWWNFFFGSNPGHPDGLGKSIQNIYSGT